MLIQRTIPITLDKNQLVSDTVVEFNRYQQVISPFCFNSGKPLRAFDLQKAVYHQVASTLKSQMRCSAIRATAAAYAAVKANRRKVTKPFVFKKPSALWLYGKDFPSEVMEVYL